MYHIPRYLYSCTKFSMVVINIIQNSDPGSWIIPPISIGLPPYQYHVSNSVEMDQEPQIYRTQQENFKKKLCKYGKSRFLIARLHFSMVVLWGQLHRDFLRFANWTSSSGRCGNFYQGPQVQHPLLCALSTAEALSCPKSIGSIGATCTTIF
jgi:hypothetical protein